MAKDEKLGEAHVDITGRLTPLKRAMIRAKGIVRKGLTTLVTIIKRGAIVMSIALAYNIYKMIRAASAAEEIQAKFGTVFRNLTKQANDWAEDYGKAVGRAAQDVKKWMAGLQDLFVPLGMTRDAAFKLDKELVKLAIDVASFNNQADEDVIRDFTSALVGNHETVRKYGIIISETALKQEALNQGIKKSYNELTNLEKVQLRYELIMRGSTDAQGDAIRTSASFANQIKRLKANLTDFWETAGTRFLESITSLVTQTNAWFTANGKLMAQGFGDWMAGIAKNARYLTEDLSILKEGLDALLEPINKLLKLSPLRNIAILLSRYVGTGELKEAREELERLEALLAKKLQGKEKAPPTKPETKGASETKTEAELAKEKQEAIAATTAKLEAQRDYYEKVGGYEKKLAQVREALRKVEAIETAKAAGLPIAEVYRKLKAKSIQASLKLDDTEMPKDIDTSVRASFIPLTEMWKTLSGGTRKINERMLDVNQKQLDETKRMREAIERGFEQQISGWVS